MPPRPLFATTLARTILPSASAQSTDGRSDQKTRIGAPIVRPASTTLLWRSEGAKSYVLEISDDRSIAPPVLTLCSMITTRVQQRC